MTRSLAPTPTLDDVAAARKRIEGVAWHTPFVRSDWLSDVTRGSVWLKLETVQTTGSFKLRGAQNAIARLSTERPEIRRVLTASAGNHGKAVALAANRAGLSARIYVPATAPAAKRQAIARLGAEIVEAATYDDAEARAHAEGARDDTAFVSAYSDPDVIAGAATIVLEMLEDQPDLELVIVPLGGGGLLSGSAIVTRARGGRTKAFGAEVEASPAFTTAIAAGRITTVDVHPTLADGLAGNMEPDSRTFDLVRTLADGVALVSEASLEQAMRDLIRREQLIVEGAGAAGVGALLQGAIDVTGKRVGVVLTGRNIDAHVIARILG